MTINNMRTIPLVFEKYREIEKGKNRFLLVEYLRMVIGNFKLLFTDRLMTSSRPYVIEEGKITERIQTIYLDTETLKFEESKDGLEGADIMIHLQAKED